MKIIYYSLIFIFVYLVTGCTSLPPTNQTGDQVCLQFEDQTSGAQYNFGQVLTTSGTQISVEQDSWTSNGQLRIDNRGYARGSGLDLNLRNANAHLLLPYPVPTVTMSFAELGGHNKIKINTVSQDIQDLVDLNGSVVGGVGVAVFATKEGNNWYGTLVLAGPINDFSLGGQEVWIDNVCFPGSTNAQIGSRILFEARYDAGQSYTDFWLDYKMDITSQGFTFGHVTEGEVSTALLNNWDLFVMRPYRYHYTEAEKNAIKSFVENGKAVIIVAEFGTPYIYPATENAMSIFSITHDNNMVVDPTNYEIENFWVVYESDRNFSTHSILDGISKIRFDAGASISATGSSILIETDDDAVPPRKPVALVLNYGAGRVFAVADSSFMHHNGYEIHDNRKFARQITEWLLFRR